MNVGGMTNRENNSMHKDTRTMRISFELIQKTAKYTNHLKTKQLLVPHTIAQTKSNTAVSQTQKHYKSS